MNATETFVEPFRRSDHACWVYGSDEEYRRVLTRYLRDGIEGGERITFYGSPPERADVAIGYLRDAGIDVDALRARGALVLGGADDVHLGGGTFEPDELIDTYRTMVADAGADGYAGLRVAAETSWLLGRPELFAGWRAYELRADLLAASVPFTALCCYDARAWDVAETRLLRSVHSMRVGGEDDEALETGFRIRGRPDGAIGLGGELDFRHAWDFETIARAAVMDAAQPVIDLSELRFADVSAVRAIASVAREMRAVHGTVEVRGAGPTFKRVWDLMRLHELARVDAGTRR